VLQVDRFSQLVDSFVVSLASRLELEVVWGELLAALLVVPQALPVW
jgi:hypothetical protein